MAPKYKLVYFDTTGRAEVMRFMFAEAGVEYEDYRVPDENESWKALRPSVPGGYLPMLEFDGFKLTQSQAISKYLAKQFGFAGKTALEEARIDSIAETIKDSVDQLTNLYYADDVTKPIMLKKYLEVQLPNTLKTLEDYAHESGYFQENQVTWADMMFATLPENLAIAGTTIDYTKYPKLKKIVDNVTARPRIAAWIEKRPKEA